MVGAILAGGSGRRMGGGKPARTLAGRPLLAYPADALAAVCERVAVVCKPGTQLPAGPWELWDDEPLEPRHPAAGIVHALARAGGPVLVCGADMPFVGVGECRRLTDAMTTDSHVVAVADGELQPLFGIYLPGAVPALREAARRGEPLRHAVDSLDPIRVALPADALRSIDTPEALAAAEQSLFSRGP